MLTDKKAILLDMNGTFMFGEDRFGAAEDFSIYYRSIGGTLASDKINTIIRATYAYLDDRYPDEIYRHNFPSLDQALREVTGNAPLGKEFKRIINTFAFHERGSIPNEYITALNSLKQQFLLAAVIDIWSPKNAWLDLFNDTGIADLFLATSFSSDHGIVKPSAKPFETVVLQLGISKQHAVVVGDSVTRDLGGAHNANIDCILVGGAHHANALASYANLLDLCDAIRNQRV